MSKIKNQCWDCGKKTVDFRCKSCLNNKVLLNHDTRPNYNRVVAPRTKEKDLIQPFHKDGTPNYEYLSRYGDEHLKKERGLDKRSKL